MKNVGKKFEEDFYNSKPYNFFIHRIKDGSARTDKAGNMIRLKNNNLCDFIMFTGYNLYLLELKSVKDKSMSFNNIDKDVKKQKEKIMKLYNESLKENLNAGYIINFRSQGKTFYVPIKNLLEFYLETDKKSINILEVEKIGKIIKQNLKRVRYTYNIKEFFK